MSALRPLLLILFLAASTPLRGADDPPSGSPVPSDPVFQALLTDGKTATGRIRQLGPGGKLTLVEKQEQVIPLDRLVKLEREGEPPAWPPEGSVVLFPEGDRLRATIGASGETALEVRPPTLGDAATSIPLDALLGVVLASPAEAEAQEALIDRVRAEPRKADVLWLANGDRLSGDFLGLGPAKAKFQAGAGPVEIDRAGVVAFGSNPATVAYPRPEGDFLELTTVDGSRLGVSAARVEQGQVVATTRFGATIRLPIGELARVHVRGRRVAYLSERDPAAVQYVSYVGPTRPYRRDAAVDGRPLRLAGRPYDRGLGMQSRTLLAYKLDGTERRFQATVGLDDGAGPLGSVVFRVLVDRKEERFASPPMSARDTPRALDVDITGARILILEVDFGDRGEVRDFADWVEARLVR